MKLHYQGVSTSPLYLTVYVTVEEGDWIRFCEAKVPMEALLDREVLKQLDSTHRRQLIDAWTEDDVCDPLFDVSDGDATQRGRTRNG